MKFVADVMLGSLTKAMRFCGYDVEYDNDADDEKLGKQSRSRVLLTKDRPLAARLTPGRAYLVQSIGAERQLDEIRAKFPLKDAKPRCIECNGTLSHVSKKKVQHLVPPFVFGRYEQFLRCRLCARIYWSGTHYEKMVRMLK
jgi:uncharacterized protein